MSIANSKNGKILRRLRKTPAIRFKTEKEAKAALDGIRYSVCPFPLRIVAIINPASGRGNAVSIYNTRVKPILENSGANVVSHITEGRGHATRIIQTIKPSEVDVILSLGGDGTMFEVLQGILQRPDWEICSELPLVQVPCGSGNALAASTGLWDVPTAVHAALKGIIAPLDIASVIQPAEGKGPSRFFSFLSFTYGMISSLDIGTEHLRFLGSFRFTVGAIHQLIKQPTFKMRVAYREPETPEEVAADSAAMALKAVEMEEAAKAEVIVSINEENSKRKTDTDASKDVENKLMALQENYRLETFGIIRIGFDEFEFKIPGEESDEDTKEQGDDDGAGPSGVPRTGKQKKGDDGEEIQPAEKEEEEDRITQRNVPPSKHFHAAHDDELKPWEVEIIAAQSNGQEKQGADASVTPNNGQNNKKNVQYIVQNVMGLMLPEQRNFLTFLSIFFKWGRFFTSCK